MTTSNWWRDEVMVYYCYNLEEYINLENAFIGGHAHNICNYMIFDLPVNGGGWMIFRFLKYILFFVI